MTTSELRSPPRTAVIGAGISGLTAGKMLKDYGVPYTTFETSDRIGGNWAFGNPNGHSSAYRSLHIDTSKHRLSFKDFPMPDDFPSFPHHTEIKAYLDAYADTFGLLEQHRVRQRCGAAPGRPTAAGRSRTRPVPPGSSTCWSSATDTTGTRGCRTFPARSPARPSTRTTTSTRRRRCELTGKRILVVGIGNSAADITVELSSKSLQNKVTLSTRSSAWIVPEIPCGTAG